MTPSGRVALMRSELAREIAQHLIDYGIGPIDAADIAQAIINRPKLQAAILAASMIEDLYERMREVH